MRRVLEERGVAGIRVGSAGTGAAPGSPASEGSYLVGLEHGLDLSAHRARVLTPDLVDVSDLVLTMSAHHRDQVAELGGASRVFLLGAYAGQTGEDAAVSDPYGASLDEYRLTYQTLDRLIRAAVDRLQAERPDDQR